MPTSIPRLTIDTTTPDDAPTAQDIWTIFHRVVQSGDTYVYPPDTSYEDFIKAWYASKTYPDIETYVARSDEPVNGIKTVGTYIIKPNFSGQGAHVCNASYMVHPDCFGHKIGRTLGEHSLVQARSKGYHAMQFNIVVSTNTAAVKLWQSLGFEIIGTSPKAFNHPTLGLVDTYIMHQFL